MLDLPSRPNVPRCQRVVLASAALAALVSITAPVGSAFAYSHSVLHSLCQQSSCKDGQEPLYLTRDSSGNFFGTTYYGGANGHGTIFELSGSSGNWSYQTLYDFCAEASCTDGDRPGYGLILDTDGNLYGVSTGGGANAAGTIFELKHKASGWKYSVLYSFCPTGLANHCPDGSYPYFTLTYVGQGSGAPWDTTSPLFGTVKNGGANNNGAVYKLTQNGTGWTEKVVYSFDTTYFPQGLIANASGDLFGIAAAGGKYGGGILFKLDHGTWTETTMHNFCSETNCTDGNKPVGFLTLDAAGDIFGVTQEGGSNCVNNGGCGVVFERKAGGGYAVLYDFCSLSSCVDGQEPFAGLTIDSSANLFGTTGYGGAHGLGAAFKLRHATWDETVLYSFCRRTACKDGSVPEAPLLIDAAGNLFGTTALGGTGGGSDGSGTIFELAH